MKEQTTRMVLRIRMHCYYENPFMHMELERKRIHACLSLLEDKIFAAASSLGLLIESVEQDVPTIVEEDEEHPQTKP